MPYIINTDRCSRFLRTGQEIERTDAQYVGVPERLICTVDFFAALWQALGIDLHKTVGLGVVGLRDFLNACQVRILRPLGQWPRGIVDLVDAQFRGAIVIASRGQLSQGIVHAGSDAAMRVDDAFWRTKLSEAR